jgi:hypothetical protein
MMEGGCDRSDDLIPYVAIAMIALRVTETLDRISNEREIALNNDEERRLRRISNLLFGATTMKLVEQRPPVVLLSSGQGGLYVGCSLTFS